MFILVYNCFITYLILLWFESKMDQSVKNNLSSTIITQCGADLKGM